MSARRRETGPVVVALLVSMTSIAAGVCDPVTWTFDESTSGEDVMWVSPTTVAPDAPRYLGGFELTEVFATVPILGAINVTELIPPESRSGSGVFIGPAPVVLFQDSVIFPPPPEPTTIAADVVVRLDGTGHGVFEATNIVLGTITVPIFGQVPILALRLVGAVSVAPLPRSDINGDCVIDVIDLLAVLAAWGTCPAGDPCLADLTRDGEVDVLDLLQLLADWS